ncbi:MAG: hypothetical protein JJD93_18165 [Ilumatobacteraceae bacterium]|nr:hypothetical protein [Ilumatobacteraceae bacterium]
MQITDVGAASPSSSVLTAGIDGCASPSPRVIESDTEIHLLLNVRFSGGDEQACLGGFQVRLAHAIGSRKVIDDRRHATLPVAFGVQIAMPVPSWLPDGWTLTDEGGSAGFARSTYAKALGAPSVTVNLTSSADGLEQFRGAESEGTATVQRRPAIWVHSIQEPAASALILHDDHWTLIIQGSDSTIGHDVVERIAESLAPLPLSTAAFAPTVPGAWVGTISEVSGKYGRAVVTGWLVIDSSGSASICDDLPADATECSGPTFVIDWYTPGSGPPDGLVARGDTLVSAAPITLHGLVKDNTISVGL